MTSERPTLFYAVPAFFAALCGSDIADDTFASVRHAVSAAEALPAETWRRFKDRFGVEILDGIGSTEDHELLSRLYAGGGRMLYAPQMLVMARVDVDRCARGYHRRWHEGHGRFHALMRSPEMERARMSLLGVPAHLFRSAARDAAGLFAAVISADWDRAFAAVLRLRFFNGFVRTRVAG